MNRLLLLLFVLLIGTGCQDTNPDESASGNTATANAAPAQATEPAPSADTAPVMSTVDSAKLLLNEAQDYVKRGILRQMPGKEVNERINPLMAQFREIYARMSPADTAIIYQYRMEQMRELAMLQVKVQEKK